MQQPKFGESLKAQRESKKLTQNELAQLCNVNIRTIQRIEKGDVTPRLYTLKLLSDSLDFDFDNGPHNTPMDSLKASFARRFVAFIIDLIILGIPTQFIFIFAAVVTPPDLTSQLAIAAPFLFILSALYFILFWYSTKGATVGMMLLKIQVAQIDGTRLLFIQSIKRYIGFILSCIPFFLGFIWILFDSQMQGWHDKIANTIVIKRKVSF